MKLSQVQWLLMLLVLLLGNCRQRTTRDSRTVFNLEKLIDEQTILLTRGDFELKKKIIIDDSVESFFQAPDSSGWQKELSIFKTADIHKPGLRDFYDKNLSEGDGIEIERYTLKDTAQSETLFLRIKRDQESHRVLSIEAAQHINNPIYHSKRNLFLHFIHPGPDKIQLDSFVVKGFQKMILQDTVSYFTAGTVIEPD